MGVILGLYWGYIRVILELRGLRGTELRIRIEAGIIVWVCWIYERFGDVDSGA